MLHNKTVNGVPKVYKSSVFRAAMARKIHVHPLPLSRIQLLSEDKCCDKFFISLTPSILNSHEIPWIFAGVFHWQRQWQCPTVMCNGLSWHIYIALYCDCYTIAGSYKAELWCIPLHSWIVKSCTCPTPSININSLTSEKQTTKFSSANFSKKFKSKL